MLRPFLICFLLLFSCAQARPFFCGKTQWRASSICDPCSKNLQSLKIGYCNPSPLNGLQTEFIFTKEGVNLIIGLLWCPITGVEDCSTEISITPIGMEPHLFNAYCYLGNQKLRLSTADTESLLKMLIQGHSLKIKFSMYETTLDAGGFAACWNESRPNRYFNF